MRAFPWERMKAGLYRVCLKIGVSLFSSSMISVPALRCASLAAVLFLSASAVQAAIALQVTVSSEHLDPADAPLAQTDAQTADIVLAKRYLSVREGKRLTVFDFSARQRYSIDMASASYEQESLFAVVAARATGTRQRKDVAALTAQQDDRAVLWSLAGQPMLKLGVASQPVSADDAQAFARFLRYTWNAHRLVLNMLADGRQIPTEFTLYQQDAAGSVARHFRVHSFTADVPETDQLSGYRPLALPAGAPMLERLLEQATRLQSWGPETHAMMRAQADQVFAAQHTFEAFLMLLEDNLSTGALVEHLSREQLLAMQACEPIQQLLRALSAKDLEIIKEGLANVQALRAQVGPEQPMLAFFEGTLRGKLGQWPEAQALYLQVLQVKPHLAAAYKELGQALYAQGQMRDAWRSWDAGRALAPTHRVFKSVDALEKNLLKEYPAFF